MNVNITVDQAISRGNWLIKYPIFFIFIFLIFIDSFYFKDILNKTLETIITILIGILTSWFYWSFTITKWRIWAYSNVRNVHELKTKALKCGLIFKEEGLLEKTEIRSFADNETLKQLEKKFLEKNIYQDDSSVPNEIIIYNSILKSVLSLIMFAFFIFIGIYYYVNSTQGGVFIFLAILFCLFSYLKFNTLMDKSPQITINEIGISIKDEKMINWSEINSAIVYSKWSGKSFDRLFSLNGRDISIKEYAITRSKLGHFLKVYRARNEKNIPI